MKKLTLKLKPQSVDRFEFYRYRWQLATISLILMLGAMFWIAFDQTPTGLNQAEISSTVDSVYIGVTNFLTQERMINLPYKITQKITVKLLGLSYFSIKLPSILMAIGLAWLLVRLFTTWINRRTSLVAVVVVIATSNLLFLSQHGTASITLPFFTLLLIYLIDLASQGFDRVTSYRLQYGRYNPDLLQSISHLAFIMMLTAVALVYTESGLYALLILTLVSLIHPRWRLLFRKLPGLLEQKWRWIVFGLPIALVLPLIINSLAGYFTLELLANFDAFGLNVGQNLELLGMKFLGLQYASYSLANTPILTLSSTALAIFGLVSVWSNREHPRQLMLIIWLALVLILGCFNNRLQNLILTPLILLIGYGINFLITSWYAIFPRNPYARVFGLLSIGVFLFFTVLTGLDFYQNYYRYTPGVANLFRDDLSTITKIAKEQPVVRLVANRQNHEFEFYQILAKRHPNIKEVSDYFNPAYKEGWQVVTYYARDTIRNSLPDQIYTDHFTSQSDRFYVWKNQAN